MDFVAYKYEEKKTFFMLKNSKGLTQFNLIFNF